MDFLNKNESTSFVCILFKHNGNVTFSMLYVYNNDWPVPFKINLSSFIAMLNT